ncbi:MAG TPA: tail fiber domain-containing protein [Saprospiraceae bacterium]|nr:tail fiber domain-containing protein [Saprospiraceae bacterium]
MRYLIALLISLPVLTEAQNIGIYIDTSGRVAIRNDTVWEPFQVFAEAGTGMEQLDQQSAEMGNTSGLLITPTVKAGQSLTCGLTGELVMISLRMATADPSETSMLEMKIRDGDQPTGPILTTQTFTVTDNSLEWYDVMLDPGTLVNAGDALFIEVEHMSGDHGVWDWIEGTNEYTDGSSWQFAGTWNVLESSDLVFRTYVEATEILDVFSVTSGARVKIHDYTLPAADGTSDQVMVTDGAGNLSWQTVSGSGSGSLIQDADGDTKIQVEETSDDDVIRFDNAGVEYFRILDGRLETVNTGNSVFIGEGAGANDDLDLNANVFVGKDAGTNNISGYQNVAIGYQSGKDNVDGLYNTAYGSRSLEKNTTGDENTAAGFSALSFNTSGNYNTAIGSTALITNTMGGENSAVGNGALYSNETGNYNTALGVATGLNNTTGSGNVFLGYRAGSFETGSDKLYIENSSADATSALIYGDFSQDMLRINGMLNISNAYSFPTTDGSFGQVLQTDGSGILSWQSVGGSGSMSFIEDTDGDTKIQTEEAANEDVIRFDLGGTEKMVLRQNASGQERLEIGSGTNTGVGMHALLSNTTGTNNTAFGRETLGLNTMGKENTASGTYALFGNSTGDNNSASGSYALYSNIDGNSNSAFGRAALYLNAEGSFNTAMGRDALYFNTEGGENTAIGSLALYSNVAGTHATAIGFGAMRYANNTSTFFFNHNVAMGHDALRGSTDASTNTGNSNTAIGYQTLVYNSTGSENTATGSQALHNNIEGNYNTATGFEALFTNDTGLRNTATGHSALGSNSDGDNNTAVGIFALEFNGSGNNNTALGYSANSNSGDFSNTTGIGYDADPTASNRIHVGNSSVSWIGGQVGWSTYSDGRFKSNITEDVVGLDFIKKLRPVMYNVDLDAIQDWKALHYDARDSALYDDKYEIESYRFSGFIAQEVENASRSANYTFSGLCPPKNEKDFYSLRYAEFVVPLVKAVQELSVENKNLKTQNDVLLDLINHLEMRVSAIEEK